MFDSSVILNGELRSFRSRYGVAVGSVALAVAITVFLRPIIEPSVFSLFFAAVMLSAWSGGLGPGLLSTVLAAIAIETIFIHDRSPSRFLHGYVRLAVFALVAMLINSLTAARKRAEEALRQAQVDLEHKVQERTAELAHTNEDLRFEISERKRAEEENRKILCDLAERVKELTALHRVAHLLQGDDQEPSRLLEEIVKIARAALRYPEVSAVRAAFEGAEFATRGFSVALPERHHVDFATRQGKRGAIEIAYLEKPQTSNVDGRPFSIEEIKLVESLSEMLRSYFQRREAAAQIARVSSELADSNRELWRLQSEIKRVEPLAALGQVTGTIAHELGTPLNSVLGYTQLLFQDNLSDNARRRLEIIKNQVIRMADIINHYLAQTRRPLQKQQRISLNSLIEETLITLKPIFQQHEITVRKELADSLPELLGDGPSLQRVLINILDNSIDAIGINGTITITTQRRAASGVKPPGVMITIRDSGPGIAQDMLPKIFDMFVTTKPPGEGSGLGLSISQQIVKAHGGTLELNSEPGSGACARIFLPAQYLANETEGCQRT